MGGVLGLEDQVSGGVIGGGLGVETRWDFGGGKEITYSVYDEAHGLRHSSENHPNTSWH